jgi:outer membrane protein assembly factor BamB
MAQDVFISYESSDKTIADAICATLEQKRTRCWYAPRDIVAGTDWAASIIKAINESSLMIVVFSARTNRSQQVKNEVGAAVSAGIPIIPFRIDDATPTGALGLHLQSGHWLDAMTPPLERHLSTLVALVTALLRERPDRRKQRGGLIKSTVPARTALIAALAVIVILATALAFAGLLPTRTSPGQTPNGPGAVAQGVVIKWQYDTGDAVTASPVLSNQMVFVGSYDHYLIGVAADDGLVQWKFKTGDATWTSLAASGGMVYASSSEGDIYAFSHNGDNISIKWRTNIGPGGSPLFTLANASIYATSPEGDLYALNATDGAILWTSGAHSPMPFIPAVYNGTVYTGSSDGQLYATYANNGSLKWQTKLGDNATSSAATWGGSVYVSTSDGSVYCVNASTGAIAWRSQVTDAPLTSPAVSNNVVIVGDEDGSVHTLNGAGTATWTYKTGGSIMAGPIIANDTAYFGGGDHFVYACNVTNGSVLWRFETGSDLRVAPLVANDVLYVGSDDHFLYALFLS